MKKIIALLMAVLMTAGMLAACSGTPAETTSPAAENTKAQAETAAVSAEKEKVALKVWADQGELELTEKLCSEFAAEHPEKEYTFEYGAVGAVDGKARYLEDPAAAADVFLFADDQLVDLVSTEQSAVLCEYDQPIRYYVPGAAVTEPDASTPEMAGRYLFHDLLTGEEKDLYDANTDDATLAIYAVDGTVRVFDLQTGVLLTDTTIDPVENQVRTHISPEGNGWAWIEQDDNDSYDATAIHICGPDGIHKTLDPAKLNETYNYYSPLLSTEDGIYFYGCYNGPGSSWLYDVLDSDGNVVVSGLRTCAGYYANSVNGLPEGVFAAVKGFESGWMDLTGQWLYAESIFASSNDEMDNGFF